MDALRDEAYALRKSALMALGTVQSLPRPQSWQKDPLMHLTQHLRSELEARHPS